MTNADDPTPTPGDDVCERTVLLDADAGRVIEALTSPDLLSAWLGDWSTDADADASGDTGASVVTDDGVERRVRRLDDGPAGQIAWRWSPAGDPRSWSDVRFTVTTEGDRTRLTVTETRPAAAFASRHTAVASAAATAPAVSWLGSLLALGAVLAVGSLVAV